MQIVDINRKQKVIVGLGQTGLSCAKYLHSINEEFAVVDSRLAPPGLAKLKELCPNVEVELGSFKESTLMGAKELIVSPGVDLREPAIKNARAKGVPISGDINIFAKKVAAPIIAVTGSNAKSTVVTLLGEMAKKAGIKVAVAGNIGVPVLDLLQGSNYELYVLELSSFQLETTVALGAEVATVLNISPDHMDRYDSMQSYHEAKHKIFQSCKQAVINRDDLLSTPLLPESVKQWRFGLSAGDLFEFGLVNVEGESFLAFNQEPLLAVNKLKIVGQHNISNALAALALGHAAGIKFDAMLAALKEFPGLPHRCQWISQQHGVNYYNDSKGTNVGACIAAIEGLGKPNKVILLAGGVGKGGEFSALAKPLAKFAKLLIVFGEDADLIKQSVGTSVTVIKAASLEDAVDTARESAKEGDLVLMSPACASFDMYKNYEERGDAFVHAVEALH